MKTVEFYINFGDEIDKRTLDALRQFTGKDVKIKDCVKQPLSRNDYACAHNTYYYQYSENI